MRLIERKMNRAILDSENWKLDNTQVSNCAEDDVTFVYLHGNKIAEIGETFIKLYTCGYKTKTTKSRLNAILSDHGNGARIYQKSFDWFVNDNGQSVPFTEGMILV
jgi:hypothetical protein